ncbi:hypothetical protein [Achromobacter sp. AGC39]
MPKFDDCLSCAFYGEEPAICEECEDADQWVEGDVDYDDSLAARGRALRGNVIPIRAQAPHRPCAHVQTQFPIELKKAA